MKTNPERIKMSRTDAETAKSLAISGFKQIIRIETYQAAKFNWLVVIRHFEVRYLTFLILAPLRVLIISHAAHFHLNQKNRKKYRRFLKLFLSKKK